MNDYEIPWLLSRKVKVGIIGDVIVDEYLNGLVNRISPEAPIPVHLVTDLQMTAGGAANVARNIQLSGGQAYLVGFWGNDESAKNLNNLLLREQVDTSQMLTIQDRPTIRKMRVTANHQQLLRIDWEKVQPLSTHEADKLLEKVSHLNVNAFLISDYGKGLLTENLVREIIDLARERRIPVIIDPKAKDFSSYQGADLITPNRNEACLAAGIDNTDKPAQEQIAKKLREKYQLKNILITLGAEGMYLDPYPTGKGEYLKAQAREVFDVSGAGDTVAAIMSLTVAAGASLSRGMFLANLAAGIVVEKWGTQPVTLEQIRQRLESNEQRSVTRSDAKIKSLDELHGLIQDKPKRTRKIVFTNGCFDILHAGHITYLEQAKQLGDVLIVGVNSDTSIRKLKGKGRPIINNPHRMKVLAALDSVDYVFEFDEETPILAIKNLVPDILVKGSDYKKAEIVGHDIVEATGGKIVTIDLVPDLSTSKIIEKIQKHT